MIFETISVFPGVFDAYLSASIMGRAERAGIAEFAHHDLRDWTHDRHRTVDDAPFGGGQGMLMKPAPIYEAVRAVKAATTCSRWATTSSPAVSSPPWSSSTPS